MIEYTVRYSFCLHIQDSIDYTIGLKRLHRVINLLLLIFVESLTQCKLKYQIHNKISMGISRIPASFIKING